MMYSKIVEIQREIKHLENQLIDLKKRWPAHSLKPDMFNQLENIEDQLEYYRSLLENENNKTIDLGGDRSE